MTIGLPACRYSRTKPTKSTKFIITRSFNAEPKAKFIGWILIGILLCDEKRDFALTTSGSQFATIVDEYVVSVHQISVGSFKS